MTMSIHTTFRLAVLASVAILTACGGGGGGGGGAAAFVPAAATPATEAAAPSTPPATVAPSAAPGSEENAAFELLNNERLNCGFGSLARNSQLDEAARGHAKWLLVNNVAGHYQEEGTPAFTGTDAEARIRAAGYNPVRYEDESTTMTGRSQAVGFGALGVRTLLSAPYHLAGMVSGARDIGVSIMSSDDVGTTSKFKRVLAQFNLAYTALDGRQDGTVGAVRSYPCNATTGTFSTLSNEVPNPVPGRNLAASPVGQPVYLLGDADKALTISSTLMQETVTGNTVTLLAPITSATDPSKTLKVNEAIVFPDAPLKTNAEYAVTIVGTNGGTSFTKDFKFKTGALAEATSAPR